MPNKKSIFQAIFLTIILLLSLSHSGFTDSSATELKIQFKTIEELYLRTHSYLKKFDTTLDEHLHENETSITSFYADLIESGTYSHLLTFRDRLEEHQNEIVQLIQENLAVLNDSHDSNSTPQDQSLARNTIDWIAHYYHELPAPLLLAHYPIATSLHDLEIKDAHFKTALDRVLRAEEDLLNETSSNSGYSLNPFIQLFWNHSIETQIDEQAILLEDKTTPISNDIEEQAAEIQNELAPALEKLSSKSARFAPSTGPQGNITGNQFPPGVWSFTFDDGPHKIHSQKILKNLIDHEMKSTFFMLAQQVKLYPQIALKIQNAGMEIANHSYSHAQLPKISTNRLRHEIHDSQEVIAEVLHKKPQLFRLPYGAGVHVSRIRAQLAAEDLIHVFWNVDSLDWHDRNPASIVARVKKQLRLSRKNGGIILFHDIHPQSVEASRQIMDYMTEKNKNNPGQFRIMPVGDVMNMLESELTQ